MIKKNIKLPIKLNEYQLDLFKKKIYFIFSNITDFRCVVDGEKTCDEVELYLTENVDDKILEKKINKIIETDIKGRRFFPDKVIWKNDGINQINANKNIYSELIRNGYIYEVGEGQVTLGSLFIHLIEYLDKKISNISINELNAIEYQYPTLIPVSVIEKSGYYTSFPQLNMFVSCLHNDIDNYIDFQRAYKENNKLPEDTLVNYTKGVKYALPPTMCYHTYNQFEGDLFEKNEHRVYTSKGKSFRYETKYCKTLERLVDFTIRETVFMGDFDFVIKSREKFMNSMFSLMKNLEITCYCSNSNDPFFTDEKMNEKIAFQNVLKSKYELRVFIDNDNTIAVGSFNYHHDFISKAYDLHYDSDHIRTGCTGIGLERLAYAFVCQHGTNISKWPREVKEYMEKYYKK